MDQNNSSSLTQDSNSTTPLSATGFEQEFAHITQEIYKKNFELAQTNKTLSLLRKIDEITLSSVTDLHQTSQNIVDAVAVNAGYKLVVIYLLEKKDNTLVRLAVSQNDLLKQAEAQIGKSFSDLRIPLSVDNNIVVKAVKEKKIQITNSLYDILLPHFSQEEAKKMQDSMGIISSFVYPLIARGEVIGALRISVDESESNVSEYQKSLSDRLVGVIGIAINNSLLYQKIQEVNEQLKQLDKLKDEFVSLASHELRTPMTAIKSYLWMVLKGKGGDLKEKQKYYIDRAYSSTQRLINLVNDMLNVSRIESGRMAFSMQSAQPESLVKDTIEELLPRARELGISVIFTPSLSPLPQVLADPDKIKEVLINLIGNSFKFTQKNGSITVSLSQKDTLVQFEVKDTGRGISGEDLTKLFQKFGMVGNDTKTLNAQGTGLGLYICKSIIDLHGGKIWAVSDGIDKGATFAFTLKVFNKFDLEYFQKLKAEKDPVGIIHSSL